MPKYFVTKYATTDGKIIVKQDMKLSSCGKYVRSESRGWVMFQLGRDVFTDEAEARAAVIEARDKRIASLEKQIAKLRKVEPSIQ